MKTIFPHNFYCCISTILHSMVFVLLLLVSVKANGDTMDDKYRRNSVYSMLISHIEQEDFCTLIQGQFMNIPVSDKFNDHNLSVRVISVEGKKEVTEQTVTDFVNRNNIASHMVAKWFNRDQNTGQCDMTLIKNRGLYNASEFDREIAAHSMRGNALLEDAGEDLIGNTYLIVNDIRYIDKNKVAKKIGSIFTIVTMVAAAAAGAKLGDDYAKNMMSLFDALKGFSVRINSYLYQLEWNDNLANTFYSQCYSDVPSESKKDAFLKYSKDYKLKFLGSVTSKGSTTSYAGIKKRQPWLMVRKAMERAIDENVVDLQKMIPAFRAKIPISAIGTFVKAPIGKKEGVEAGKKYEVLEARLNNGKMTYKRVGVVKPNPMMIWDNRFMASEENSPGSSLGATSFIIVSGSNFMPGMLLREM